MKRTVILWPVCLCLALCLILPSCGAEPVNTNGDESSMYSSTESSAATMSEGPKSTQEASSVGKATSSDTTTTRRNTTTTAKQTTTQASISEESGTPQTSPTGGSEYIYDHVLVVIKSEYSMKDKIWQPSDFPDVDILRIDYGDDIPCENGIEQQLLLFLNQTGYHNVFSAMKKLEKYEMVKHVYPSSYQWTC